MGKTIRRFNNDGMKRIKQVQSNTKQRFNFDADIYDDDEDNYEYASPDNTDNQESDNG